MSKSFRQIYQDEREATKKSAVACFFSALDAELEGNKLYDWYWHHIWAPVWRVCYCKPKEHKEQKVYDEQRIKCGISEQDSWSITDWLLETMYYGLGSFLVGEYGTEEPNWKTWICSTHDRKLYNAIIKYRKEYEHLLNIRKRLEVFDDLGEPIDTWLPEYREITEQESKIEQECIDQLSKLIGKYLGVLWW